MAEKFLMPKLSPTMEEGQIARWVKNEGDSYEANETLAEVDTDKATMEMTALTGGTLLKIIKDEGETAALGEPIAITGDKGEDISAILKEISGNGAAAKKGEAKATEEKTPEGKKEAAEEEIEPEEKPNETSEPKEKTSEKKPRAEEKHAAESRMIVSPIAARMAGENAVDLRSINGSGPGGRIVKRDIEEA